MAVSSAARGCIGLPEPTDADVRSLFGAPDEEAAEAGGDAAAAGGSATRRRVSKHRSDKKSGGAGTAAKGSGKA